MVTAESPDRNCRRPASRRGREVAVIGCGVIGLTSAIRLAEAGYRVRVVAKARSPDTTSDIAAAVWFPFRTEQSDRAQGWARETLGFLSGLASDPGAGVTLTPGIALSRAARMDPPPWHDAIADFRPARPDELPVGYAAGHVFAVPVIRMPRHLAWLGDRLAALGGTAEIGREVTPADLDRLCAGHAAVVNCTGLGARDLVGDSDVFPIRGQIVRVAPGHARRFVQGAEGEADVTYVIPRPDCTVLGGTTDRDAWDTTPDPAVASAILARCAALEPALARAAVLSHAVGLRPGRATVRLAAERRAGGLLVHNYGHGGAGVTLGWGCAGAVVRMVARMLEGRRS